MCPICEIADEVLWGAHPAGYTIARCRACGLRYVHSTPGDGAAPYGERYFDRQRRREADPEIARFVAENDRRYAAAILGHARVTNPTVLDIGTGRGSFLVHLSVTPGFGRVAGTDITDANVGHLRAHGIEIHVGEIGELDLGRWDVVTAHHVLEHVPDPNAFLSRVRELLDERGIVHLVLPNERGLVSRWKALQSHSGMASRPFKYLSPDQHRWFFDRETLARLLQKNGLRVVRAATMAGAKRRSAPNRLLHRGLDALRLGTWLDVVAEPDRRGGSVG